MNKIEEIAQAIRTDLKHVGIKGFSVSRKFFAADIAVIIKLPKSAYIPADDFVKKYRITRMPVEARNNRGMVELISAAAYRCLSPDEQEKVRISAARREYQRKAESEHTFYGCFAAPETTVYTPETVEILKKIKNIIEIYHYDKSDLMIDYVDTNFSYAIRTKPTAK